LAERHATLGSRGDEVLRMRERVMRPIGVSSAAGGRARLKGEEIVIGGAFAQTFALVVHELATNAKTPRSSSRG
jgi:two-component sensor histidine kinase